MASASSQPMALASKARAQPIRREDSTESFSSVEVDADPNSRIYSILCFIHGVPEFIESKGLSPLILGGFFKDPPRSWSRRTPFSPIERLSEGQFRFERPDGGFAYRDLLLESSQGSRGVWRKVYTSPQYGTKAFKFSPVTDDSQWMTAEIRVFRKLIDYTTGFMQEFRSCVTLIDSGMDEENPERIKQMLFNVMVVERVARFSSADWAGIDPEEMISHDLGHISCS